MSRNRFCNRIITPISINRVFSPFDKYEYKQEEVLKYFYKLLDQQDMAKKIIIVFALLFALLCSALGVLHGDGMMEMKGEGTTMTASAAPPMMHKETPMMDKAPKMEKAAPKKAKNKGGMKKSKNGKKSAKKQTKAAAPAQQAGKNSSWNNMGIEEIIMKIPAGISQANVGKAMCGKA